MPPDLITNRVITELRNLLPPDELSTGCRNIVIAGRLTARLNELDPGNTPHTHRRETTPR